MNTLRILLIWFVAFAFPLQGFAAASKALCHAAATSTAPVVQVLADHDQHHEHMMQSADARSATSSPTHTVSGDHKCSTCAQCFFGMALMGASVQTQVFPAAAPVKVARALSMHSRWMPSGIERPPRPSLF